MTRSPAYLASLVAAGPSAHEQTSFTAYATLPLSGLRGFQQSFGIHEHLPHDDVTCEPPVVLMPARWPVAGEPDETVIAEASVDCLEELCADGRIPEPVRAGLILRLTVLIALAPSRREPA